jgi:hypothetical protein
MTSEVDHVVMIESQVALRISTIAAHGRIALYVF